MIELALGLFALALVVSALCAFAVFMAKSLRVQNELRRNGRSNSRTEQVEVGSFEAANFTGTSVLKIKERVVLPERTIVR